MAAKYQRDWIERVHWLAVRVVNIVRKLPRDPAGFQMAAQLARSGPSVALNLEEAKASLTQPETLRMTAIARKESTETRRALMIVRDSELLPVEERQELAALIAEYTEVVAMLTAGTKRLQAAIKLKQQKKAA